MNPPPEPSPRPALWTTGPRRRLLKTPIFGVDAVTFTHPRRGSPGREFVVIEAPDWGIALPVTPEGELVLVRQFRFGSGELSWELPGGVIEPAESPLVATQRELREETGYAGRTARLLGRVRPNPAVFSNHCHIVLVEDVVPAGAVAWDQHEEMEIRVRPVREVLAEARQGTITHALMLNALFLLEPWWRERFATRLT